MCGVERGRREEEVRRVRGGGREGSGEDGVRERGRMGCRGVGSEWSVWG